MSGNGTSNSSSAYAVVENVFYDVAVGVDYTMGIIQGGVGVPWAVPPEIKKTIVPRDSLFTDLEAGYSHSCGVTEYDATPVEEEVACGAFTSQQKLALGVVQRAVEVAGGRPGETVDKCFL